MKKNKLENSFSAQNTLSPKRGNPKSIIKTFHNLKTFSAILEKQSTPRKQHTERKYETAT